MAKQLKSELISSNIPVQRPLPTYQVKKDTHPELYDKIINNEGGLPQGMIALTDEEGNNQVKLILEDRGTWEDAVDLGGLGEIVDTEPIAVLDYDSPKTEVDLTPPFVSVDLPSATAGGIVEPSRASLVDNTTALGSSTDPNKPKGRVAKFTVLATDNGTTPISESDGVIRSEGKAFLPAPTSLPIEQWPLAINTEVWIGESVYIPSDFVHGTSGAQWMVITQLKGLNGGNPPISIELSGQNFRVGGSRANSNLIPNTTTPFTKGTWNRIEFGVFLSTSNTEGWVEVWINGQQVLARTSVSTMDIVGGNPDPVYLKQGIYRPFPWKANHTLYFGSVKVGRTHESVMDTPLPVSSLDLNTLATKSLVRSAITSANTFTTNTRTVLFGDSLVAQSTGGNATQLAYQSITFFSWLTLLLKGAVYLPPTGNKGVSGNTTTQMIARLGAATALNPKLTVIEAGTNDLNSLSAQQTIINLTRIYKAFVAVGSKVVIVTILPRFGTEALSTANEAKRVTINNFLKSIVDPNVFVIDGDIVMSNSIYFSDGLHLNSTGGYRLAKFISDQIGYLFADTPKPSDALTADMSNNTNLYFTGTGGLTQGGASGVVAANYQLNAKSITGLTTVGSIKTVDGVNSQVITLSGTYTGNNQSIDLTVYTTTTIPVTGNVIEAVSEYTILTNDPNVLAVNTVAVVFGSSGLLNAVEGMAPSDQLSNPQEANVSYVARTPSIKILAGTTTGVDVKVNIILKNQTVATPINFSIEVKRLGLRNVELSQQ